jgi:predicted esterase
VRRWLSRGLAAAAIVPIAVLAFIGVLAPWSPSGWLILALGAPGAAAGFVKAPRARRLMRGLAAGAIAALIVVRLLVPSGGSNSMRTLPGGTSSRWLGRVVDEQDLSLLGARALTWRWPMTREERDGLVRDTRDAYLEMRGEDGASPSPVLDTVLGRQAPGAFDAVILEPPEGAPRAAVLFLHGYGGSFRMECWLVAKAARAIGALTVCPADGFAGHWGGHDGERIAAATLDYLRARGIRRVYLAGLSNGAAGAGVLAPRLAPSLAGLILISGASGRGASGGLPTLVIQGEHDPIASAHAARAFAAANHATYAGFDGGHFVLLMRRRETGAAIADWLRRREASAR